MDRQKYIMLKAIIPTKEEVTIGMIKNELDVDSDEALEMLDSLKQEGMVELFALDGTHFKVIK